VVAVSFNKSRVGERAASVVRRTQDTTVRPAGAQRGPD